MKIVNTTNTNSIGPLSGESADVNKFGNRKAFISFGGSKFGGKSALSPLEEKTRDARKKAMKLVSDAFNGVKEADKMMDDQRDRFKELSDEVSELNSQIKSMKENALPEDASQEERDAYNESIKEYQKQADAAKAEMHAIDQSLRSSKIERLKTDPVGDAFDQADKIMDAAVDAALGEMTSDAMNHIQEDLEEKQEQAGRSGRKAGTGRKNQRGEGRTRRKDREGQGEEGRTRGTYRRDPGGYNIRESARHDRDRSSGSGQKYS